MPQKKGRSIHAVHTCIVVTHPAFTKTVNDGNDDISFQSLRNRSVLGLMLIWGTSAGLFNASITILPQMLCSYGYINVSHLCIAML